MLKHSLLATLFLVSIAALNSFSGEATSTVYLLTSDGKLASVPIPSAAAVAAAKPLAISTPVTITNITPGETLVAIDVRPQTQRLYALGINATTNTGTLYHVSPETAFAGVVGATAGSISFTTDGATAVDFPDPATVPYDIDFNPAVDRIRVVAGNLNFRINPSTGLGVDGDNTGLTSGAVTGTNPDGAINGGTTVVFGAAYTNNQPNNGSITTLYTLDPTTNMLFIQNSANAGTQTAGQFVTLNGSTLDFAIVNGFDILPGVNVMASNSAATGDSYAILSAGGVSGLYRINLGTAVATKLGNLSARSSAIRTELGQVVALDASGTNLHRFSTLSPGTVTTQAINLAPLAAGEQLVAMDFRPQTGQFYALAVNATTDTGTLYLLDPQGGALTAVGAQGSIAFVTAAAAAVDLPDPATTGYGFDFNPTVDRIRVTTSTGLNFRLNPNNGAPVDGDLGGAAGSVAGVNTDGPINGLSSAGIAAAAYTNSFTQVLTGGTTRLMTIEPTQNRLYFQNPPNAGTQTLPLTLTQNGVALDVTNQLGFDIPASIAANPEGWLTATVSGFTSLARLDIATGATTFISLIGAGSTPMPSLSVFTTAALIVESPPGTVLYDNLDSISFGTAPVGTPVTRSVTLRNTGTQILTYTAAAPAPITVTQNATGSILPFATVAVELTFTPVGPGSLNETLTITSSDTTVTSFEVALTGTVPPLVPTVTAPTSSAITTTTATLGGNVTSNGGAALTERGVIFAPTSANANLVIGEAGVTKVVGPGTTTGVFTVPVTGLTASTGYSFKAYAINSVGTSYTTVATFTTALLPPHHFAVTAPAAVVPGASFYFTVVAQDINNNTVKNYTGSVKFTSTDAAAALPLNQTLINGIGSFTAVLNTAGIQTITATDNATPTIIGVSGNIFVGPPVTFTSNPGTPTAIIDVNTSFTAVASSPTAVITWDFGDGTPTATGGTVNHIYTVTGTYTVKVTALDITGATVSSTSTIVVSDLLIGETAFLPGTLPIFVLKGKIATLSKTAQIEGTIPVAIPAVLGQTVLVSVNGYSKSFVLDSKGASKTKEETFTLKPAKLAAKLANFKLTLKSATAVALISKEATLDTLNRPKKVLLKITVAGQTSSYVTTLNYSKAGKTGTATFGLK